MTLLGKLMQTAKVLENTGGDVQLKDGNHRKREDEINKYLDGVLLYVGKVRRNG